MTSHDCRCSCDSARLHCGDQRHVVRIWPTHPRTWKVRGKPWENHGKSWEKPWENPAEKMWDSNWWGKPVEKHVVLGKMWRTDWKPSKKQMDLKLIRQVFSQLLIRISCCPWTIGYFAISFLAIHGLDMHKSAGLNHHKPLINHHGHGFNPASSTLKTYKNWNSFL